MKLDALVIAAHPDDAEISCGGTILRLIDAGRRVGIIDVTRGEMGTRGSVADRDRETQAANELMGVAVRHNLDLPDGRVVASIEARERLAALVREHRPEIVFAHHTEDLHPDHAATGELARSAWYLAGLKRLAAESGGDTAHRPARILHFMGHVTFDPTFIVDIGPVWERKRELVLCYASQFRAQHESDRGEHFLFGSDILERVETKARFWGERAGVQYGEPLLHRGPVPCADPSALFGS